MSMKQYSDKPWQVKDIMKITITKPCPRCNKEMNIELADWYGTGDFSGVNYESKKYISEIDVFRCPHCSFMISGFSQWLYMMYEISRGR